MTISPKTLERHKRRQEAVEAFNQKHLATILDNIKTKMLHKKVSDNAYYSSAGFVYNIYIPYDVMWYRTSLASAKNTMLNIYCSALIRVEYESLNLKPKSELANIKVETLAMTGHIGRLLWQGEWFTPRTDKHNPFMPFILEPTESAGYLAIKNGNNIYLFTPGCSGYKRARHFYNTMALKEMFSSADQ